MVLFRRLARQVVGPPGGLDWNVPWHEILHLWHERLHEFVVHGKMMFWSRSALKRYWEFAAYMMGLPCDRWLRRVLEWDPEGTRSVGRPRNSWDDLIVKFCHQHKIGDWRIAAMDSQSWLKLTDDFIGYFCQAAIRQDC